MNAIQSSRPLPPHFYRIWSMSRSCPFLRRHCSCIVNPRLFIKSDPHGRYALVWLVLVFVLQVLNEWMFTDWFHGAEWMGSFGQGLSRCHRQLKIALWSILAISRQTIRTLLRFPTELQLELVCTGTSFYFRLWWTDSTNSRKVNSSDLYACSLTDL